MCQWGHICLTRTIFICLLRHYHQHYLYLSTRNSPTCPDLPTPSVQINYSGRRPLNPSEQRCSLTSLDKHQTSYRARLRAEHYKAPTCLLSLQVPVGGEEDGSLGEKTAGQEEQSDAGGVADWLQGETLHEMSAAPEGESAEGCLH